MNGLKIAFINKSSTRNFYKLLHKQYSLKYEQRLSSIHKSDKSIDEVKDLKYFLIDNHSRMHNYLRISLTERCNLRCQYCMPESGVDLTPNEKLLTRTELMKLIRIFTKAGVDKVRLTGGEPTIRKDLLEIIEEIRCIPQIKCISMTTNGIILKSKLKLLKEAGLDNINISLDTLVEAKFAFITRRNGLNKVLESIDHALETGYQPVKINCVVINGLNQDEILNFVEFTRNKNVYVRFIEYMPFDGNSWNDKKIMSYEEIIKKVKAKYQLVKVEDGLNDTSKGFQVPGYIGKVGFITSMTDHFCGSCNRLRLTADGNLKVCLFSNKEINLRDMIRNNESDENILNKIKNALGEKKFSHEGMYKIAENKNRPMITIGG